MGVFYTIQIGKYYKWDFFFLFEIQLLVIYQHTTSGKKQSTNKMSML